MKLINMIGTSAFVVSSAFAANAFAGESDHFTKLDTDGNGMISSEEAAADPALLQDWTTADADGNGQLERAEFSALEQKSEMSKEK